MTVSVLYDRYRVEHPIATGAVGLVFAATDLRTGEDVVVKVFPRIEGMSRRPQGVDWNKEMRLAFRLRHPHIVRCLNAAFDGPDRDPMLVFERIAGGSLRRALVTEKSLAPSVVRKMVCDVAKALAHAHQVGVLHRDVKPENILRDGDRWLVTDFGSGRHLERGSQAGTLIGSLEYMAPETFANASGFATDQYGLGVVGWEALFGSRPTPEAVRRPWSGPPDGWNLEAVLQRMLQGHPSRRWPSIASVPLVLERQPVAVTDGPSCGTLVLDGEGAVWSDRSTETPVWRGTRAFGFCHVPGSEPVLQAGRRLVRFESSGTRTVYAQDLEFSTLAVCDDGSHMLLHVDREIWLVRANDRVVRRWPVGSELRFTQEQRWGFWDGLSVASWVPDGRQAWFWRLDQDRLEPREVQFELPIRELRTVQGQTGWVLGDASRTAWISAEGRIETPHPYGHVMPVAEGSTVTLSAHEPMDDAGVQS